LFVGGTNNPYVVKELLGHTIFVMTKRYAHRYPESLRHGVEVLDSRGYVLATFDKNSNKPTIDILS
jgi:hypothetical protein